VDGEKMIDLSESDIRRIATKTLKHLGFSVDAYSDNRMSRNTKGAADLAVNITDTALWLHIEVKKPGGKVRPEQSERVKAGKHIICDSVESIIRAVLSAKHEAK
jgi:hypothetical protein